MDITNLIKLLPPLEMSKFLTELLNEFQNPSEFKSKYSSELQKYVEIEGVGLKPIAVTLGGLMSIAGAIVSYCLFSDSLKYIITSPEVERGDKAFELSKKYLDIFISIGLEKIVIPFNDFPKYNEANMLFEILKKGSIIVQGVSVELAIWLGRNAGVGRLIIYRPLKDKVILKFI